ncbi:MAG: hypothetical protein RIS34_979 [Pseudomonadota bacterium]|jgi:hypothetical protein
MLHLQSKRIGLFGNFTHVNDGYENISVLPRKICWSNQDAPVAR